MFERIVAQLPRDEVRLTPAATGPAFDAPRSLRRFWDECGSGYYGGLALHVFGDRFGETFHDIAMWNSEALRSFRWLVPDRYVAFAEDPFGTQFFFDRSEDDGPVHSLLLQDAVMYTVSESLAAFFEQLLDEDRRDAILNFSFYIECLTNDVNHEPGRHLTLKVPRCLGGSEAQGLIDVDAVTNVTYLGQLLQQAQNLTPSELASRLRFTVK